MTQPKYYYMQFNVSAWCNDKGVQALSHHDRSLWFEMMLIMFEATPRGYLLINGTVPDDETLARVLRIQAGELKATKLRLIAMGVPSICPDTGALFCRRMVRDEEIRRDRAAGGALGGNPKLKGKLMKVNHKDNHIVNHKDNLALVIGSFSSICLTDSTNELYKAYPRHEGKDFALKAIAKSLAVKPFEYLIVAVKEYAIAKRGSDPKFIPLPATWFNQGRYDDDRKGWHDWKTASSNGKPYVAPKPKLAPAAQARLDLERSAKTLSFGTEDPSVLAREQAKRLERQRETEEAQRAKENNGIPF